MTNDLSKMKRSETLPSTNTEQNSYLAYANSVASSRIVGKLLKFTKFGEFLSGEEGEEVPMGTELIVHGDEMYIGWQKWDDSRPVDHIMGRMCDGFEPPKRSELGDLDESLWETNDDGKPRDPWQNSAYTILYDPKAGQIYTFATSSKGGHKANGTLAKAYYTHARMTPDMFPVIQLNWYEYPHRDRKLGQIRNPKFDVVGWTNRSGIDEALRAAVGEATAQAEADQGTLDYYEEKKPEPKQVTKPARRPEPESKSLKQQLDEQKIVQEEAARLAAKRQPQPLSSATRKPRF